MRTERKICTEDGAHGEKTDCGQFLKGYPGSAQFQRGQFLRSRQYVRRMRGTDMIESRAFQEAYEKFYNAGIIPVVVFSDVKEALPLGECLMKGGLPAAEVTFRTDAAEESIRILSKNYPDLFVGAGTVLTTEQADRAIGAGAKFIVSPGFDPKIVQYCIDRDVPVCPGTQTPSEMIAAMNMGLDHVKFFPAELSGGVKMINAIGAALTKLKFMPTGGVSASNAAEYLRCERVFCAGGSWMVKKDLMQAGEWATILGLVKEASAIVRKVRTAAE